MCRVFVTRATLLKEWKCFAGVVRQFRHASLATKTDMTFTIYLPPQALEGTRVPVLYWLSGLTCTDENFITKAGAQRSAAKHGIALVCPDTSPRGAGIENETKDWDFGAGVSCLGCVIV
jgi:S-formylglutathione hydrolase